MPCPLPGTCGAASGSPIPAGAGAGGEKPETGALELGEPTVSAFEVEMLAAEFYRSESSTSRQASSAEEDLGGISRIWTHAPSPTVGLADGATFQVVRDSAATLATAL
jgi:hypothetical protein